MVSNNLKTSDEAIRREIMKEYNMEPFQVGSLSRNIRNTILYELIERYSIRQLERVTEVSRWIIANIKL